MDGWLHFWALVVAQLALLFLAYLRMRVAERAADNAKLAALQAKEASERAAQALANIPPLIVESVKLGVHQTAGDPSPRLATDATGERMLSG